jgi:hypothetical protein
MKGIGLRFFLGWLVLSLLILSSPAWASSELDIWNLTNGYVTVNVDGVFGCNTADHTYCTIPISAGSHNAVASLANGMSASRTFTVGEGQVMRWCLFMQSNQSDAVKCQAWGAQH